MAINKGTLDPDCNGIKSLDLWFLEKNFKQKFMVKSDVETKIQVEVLDLPGIYHYQDEHFG